MSEFNGWKFHKKKEGGVNEAGELGGIYRSTEDISTMAMIKKENVAAKNISEFLGSQIFQATKPDYGAKVSLIVPDTLTNILSQEGGLKSDGSEVYVKSEFFKNYSDDMYVDMDKHMSAKTKPSDFARKWEGRPLFMGTRNWWRNTLGNAFQELNYQGFDKIAPTSLLIGDFDIHTGNMGVIRDQSNENIAPKLVRIDFAGSLNNLTDNIHPHSRLRHLPGTGPTNHFREFPSQLKNNNTFVNELLDTAKVDLNSAIDNSFVELSKYYNNATLANWAKKAMGSKFKNTKIEDISVVSVKEAFKEIMRKRQQSLEEYGLQIKLGLLIKGNNKNYKVDEFALKNLIQEHTDFFKKILNTRKVQLRDRTKRSTFWGNLIGKRGPETLLMKKIAKLVTVVAKEAQQPLVKAQQLVAKIKEEQQRLVKAQQLLVKAKEAQQRLAKGQQLVAKIQEGQQHLVKAKEAQQRLAKGQQLVAKIQEGQQHLVKAKEAQQPLVKAKEQDLKNLVQTKDINVIRARDTIYTGNNVLSNILESTELGIDLITQAVRREIIAKQQTILHNLLSRANITTDKNIEIATLLPDSQDFKNFIGKSVNNKLIHHVLNNPSVNEDFEQTVNMIEIASYKKLHQLGDFKTLDWNGEKTATETMSTRSQIIKIKDVELCTLQETTLESATKITLKDGVTNKDILRYRKIDFPITIDPPNGPMHVSLVVQDAQGNNIAADKAVYFTAHYNEQGKLMETSSPMPLKFAGDNEDAIGYIERDGNIYTVPVTKGDYTAMMQEVAKNKGQNINISQIVTPLAEDHISMELKEIQGLLKPYCNTNPALQKYTPMVARNLNNTKEVYQNKR